MSRFVDPVADAREVDLGACECPGAPHDHDSARVRGLSYSELGAAGRAGWLVGGDHYDFTEGRLKILEFGVVSWNFQDSAGQTMPVDREALERLRKETVDALAAAVQAASDYALPNGSGVPSPNGSRGNASSLRTTRTRTRSTTTSS